MGRVSCERCSTKRKRRCPDLSFAPLKSNKGMTCDQNFIFQGRRLLPKIKARKSRLLGTSIAFKDFSRRPVHSRPNSVIERLYTSDGTSC